MINITTWRPAENAGRATERASSRSQCWIHLAHSVVADGRLGHVPAGRLGPDPGTPPDPVRRAPDPDPARPHPRRGARPGPRRGTGRVGAPDRRVAAVHQCPGPVRRRHRRDRAGDDDRARHLGAHPAAARVPPVADAARDRVPGVHAALRARADLRLGHQVAVGPRARSGRLAVGTAAAGRHHTERRHAAQAVGRAHLGPAARPAGTGQRRPQPLRAVRVLRARGARYLPAARRRAADVPARGTGWSGGTGDPGGPGVPGARDRAQSCRHDHGDVRRTGAEPMTFDWRDRVVVVGTGPAGMAAADELRRLGFTGDLTVLGDEAPYDRPACSKGVLSGHQNLRDVRLPAPEAPMDLRLGRRAVDLDPVRRVVVTGDGDGYGYDGPVIASGAAPLVPAGGPVGEPGLHTLHTLDDAWAGPQNLYRAERVAIAGGGPIGCEAAHPVRGLAPEAGIIDSKPCPLYRAPGRTV